jgi:general nucleoside transport system ATP-binding protein
MLLSLNNISKRFPGVVALDEVSFDLRQGEIHALLGENGAGKSTLMNILFGLLRPDSGEILVRGDRRRLHSPRDAIENGIGMVHQHFMLVPTMTVVENIMLGHELSWGPVLRRREANDLVERISRDYKLTVSPQKKIWQLSVGEQQRVEILKVLYRGAEILVLDEPTAVLTPQESESLFDTIRSMVKLGKSVIFISHKLEEVMKLSDRVTVLRRGAVQGTVKTAETNDRALARMMIGRDVMLNVCRPRRKKGASDLVLGELRNVTVRGDHGQMVLDGLNLKLPAGEICGVAGVMGNGQRELAEVLAGLRTPETGRIIIAEEDMTRADPVQRLKAGIYYIPADRTRRGAVRELSIFKNAVLKNHRFAPYSRWGVLNYRVIRTFADRVVREQDVRCPSIEVLAGTLSGGNLQKLILGRETESSSKILIAEQPTWGLDVGAIEYVRHQLCKQCEEGTAVLLISADLDEILALSNRIVVLYEGKIIYHCSGEAADRERIGLAMTGLGGE